MVKVKEEISDHTVLVLSLLVVLVVAGSTWLVLNSINEAEQTSQLGQGFIERNIETRVDYLQPEMGGSISFSIVQPKGVQ